MSAEQTGPVTVAFTRAIRPGKVKEFEDCVAGISEAASHFEGYLGTNVIRPYGGARPEYTVVVRYETPAHLKAWEDAPVRLEWVSRLDDLTLGEMTQARIGGLEYWFTPSNAPLPPRWKMAVLTWLALFPQVYWVPGLLRRLYGEQHPAVQTAASLAVIVALMTWVVMPVMTRLFSFWLAPKSAGPGEEK